MNKWPREMVTYSPEEVQTYCVNDSYWQTIRIGIKGMSTAKKLDHLDAYVLNQIDRFPAMHRRFKVQASNYINALKRGGFLNMDLEVVK